VVDDSPYIAGSNRVPPKRLYDSIGIPLERYQPWPLSRIRETAELVH
jgi:hypothetical protein